MVQSGTGDLGATLRELREARGWSLLSAIIELRRVCPEPWWIDPSTLARIEKGRPARPDPVLVKALCEIYGAEMADVDPEGYQALLALGPLIPSAVTTQTYRDEASAPSTRQTGPNTSVVGHAA